MDKIFKSKRTMYVICLSIVAILFEGLSIFFLIERYNRHYEIILDVDMLNDNLSEQGTLLIDLRDEEDYVEGHIQNAINLPYTDGGELLIKYLEKTKAYNKKIYLMCYSGYRAGMASNLLMERGYKNINYVSFGYDQYVSMMGSDFTPDIGECPCKTE